MFGLEKFLKKQKEPIEDNKINPCILKNVKEFHCRRILEDGKLYSTEKAEKFLEFNSGVYGTAYFKTQKSNFFSADFYDMEKKEYVDEDNRRIREIHRYYYDLKFESETGVKQKLGKYDIELYKKYFGDPEEG